MVSIVVIENGTRTGHGDVILDMYVEWIHASNITPIADLNVTANINATQAMEDNPQAGVWCKQRRQQEYRRSQPVPKVPPSCL